MIICAKYKKNPSRTVDATERTRFSKSRPNDLEDIGQGQGSSHATHPLMLLIICTKYGKNPPWTVDATGRTRKVNGQTDRQTDRQTGWIQYFVAGGIKTLPEYFQLISTTAIPTPYKWRVTPLFQEVGMEKSLKHVAQKVININHLALNLRQNQIQALLHGTTITDPPQLWKVSFHADCLRLFKLQK